MSTSSVGKDRRHRSSHFPIVTSGDVVYATNGYAASVTNLANTSLTTDMVFRDGVATQLAAVSGNVTDGYTAVLPIGINV